VKSTGDSHIEGHFYIGGINMHSNLESKLQELIDEREIRQVLLRYFRGVDRCDVDLIDSCYHDDATDDHGNWIKHGSEIAQHIVTLVSPGAAKAMHFVGNMLIEVEGDIAFAESYVLAYRAYEREGVPYTRVRAVRFIDRLEKRQGEWRISERVVVDDWNRVDEVTQTQEGADLFRYGSKDKNDPVYQIRLRSLAGERVAGDA